MTGLGDPISDVQQWFRSYSDTLAASYHGSSAIDHNVTKGAGRESQLFDVLEALLPRRCALERSPVVVADSQGRQCKSFDAVLADRQSWPAFYAQGLKVIPFECAQVALEVKSELNCAELDDVGAKTRSLRALEPPDGVRLSHKAKVGVFAYSCPNSMLAFLCFAAHSRRGGHCCPNLVCVLRSAVMLQAQWQGGPLLVNDWTPGTEPLMVQCGPDALLHFFNLLSGWTTDATAVTPVLQSYVTPAFERLCAHRFSADFLDLVAGSSEKLELARRAFRRPGQKSFDELYQRARRAIGLS